MKIAYTVHINIVLIYIPKSECKLVRYRYFFLCDHSFVLCSFKWLKAQKQRKLLKLC